MNNRELDRGRHDTRREVALLFRISRVLRSLRLALNEHMRAWDLSPAQFDVIAQVGSSEGRTQRDLAGSLLVTEGNITQLLDKMEKRGLVKRHALGRCNHIMLTEEGQRIHDCIVPEHETVVAEKFSALSDQEKDQLLQLLRKLGRSLKNR